MSGTLNGAKLQNMMINAISTSNAAKCESILGKIQNIKRIVLKSKNATPFDPNFIAELNSIVISNVPTSYVNFNFDLSTMKSFVVDDWNLIHRSLFPVILTENNFTRAFYKFYTSIFEMLIVGLTCSMESRIISNQPRKNSHKISTEQKNKYNEMKETAYTDSEFIKTLGGLLVNAKSNVIARNITNLEDPLVQIIWSIITIHPECIPMNETFSSIDMLRPALNENISLDPVSYDKILLELRELKSTCQNIDVLCQAEFYYKIVSENKTKPVSTLEIVDRDTSIYLKGLETLHDLLLPENDKRKKYSVGISVPATPSQNSIKLILNKISPGISEKSLSALREQIKRLTEIEIIAEIELRIRSTVKSCNNIVVNICLSSGLLFTIDVMQHIFPEIYRITQNIGWYLGMCIMLQDAESYLLFDSIDNSSKIECVSLCRDTLELISVYSNFEYRSSILNGLNKFIINIHETYSITGETTRDKCILLDFDEAYQKLKYRS